MDVSLTCEDHVTGTAHSPVPLDVPIGSRKLERRHDMIWFSLPPPRWTFIKDAHVLGSGHGPRVRPGPVLGSGHGGKAMH